MKTADLPWMSPSRIQNFHPDETPQKQQDSRVFSKINVKKNDNSEISQRIRKTFDNFYLVNDKSDEEIASMIRDLEINITVDLKGHTKQNRLNIMASRPSPIQVSYLGFPGTLGAK